VKRVSTKLVSVVGLGYIGLPTALVCAQHGYLVRGFDIDEVKIDSINKGKSPFTEQGISKLLHSTLGKNFSASDRLQAADCFVIAVPTPICSSIQFSRPNGLRKPLGTNGSNKAARPEEPGASRCEGRLEGSPAASQMPVGDGKHGKTSGGMFTVASADLTYVFQAGESIAQKLAPGNLVILESTVPVGTTYKLGKFLEKQSSLKLGKDFFLAYCPERVLPGKILEELTNNDRIIGGTCEQSSDLAKKFYEKFVTGKLHLTTAKTAELVKLIENSSRDVEIAFANQIASMCKEAQIDPFEAIALANKHPRVKILNPGCGVGGHCIAVDPWFLIEQFPQSTELLKTARNINNEKPKQIVKEVVHKATTFFAKEKKKPQIFILGITFKPNVDDTRESPALQIAQELAKNEITSNVKICEPNLLEAHVRALGFTPATNLSQAIDSSDIIVALVKHAQFEKLGNYEISNKIVIDPCGLFKLEANNHETTLLEKRKRRSTSRSNA